MQFPEAYQHLLQTVKAAREKQYLKSPTKDAKEYLDRWWTFSKPREELRPALIGQARFIATARTAKHRVFSFMTGDTLPESEVVAIALNDPYALGVLSSQVHLVWVAANKGTLEDRPRYLKSTCFDPFPFPDCGDALKVRIHAVAEELDAHRKDRQAAHPRLMLTQMYNVLEKVRSCSELNEQDERIKAEGLVLILKELHDTLDALVIQAYGWTDNVTDEQILERLVALNAERAAEERAGTVRWLRPDYQIPKFGSDADRARLEEERRRQRATEKLRPRQGALDLEDDLREIGGKGARKPSFPTGDELAETVEVMRTLVTAARPLSITDICRHYSQGKQVEKRVGLTMLALARLGHLASPDGGTSFTLRT